jgi:hypothetical protein
MNATVGKQPDHNCTAYRLAIGGANYKLTNRTLNLCYELICARKAELKEPKITLVFNPLLEKS